MAGAKREHGVFLFIGAAVWIGVGLLWWSGSGPFNAEWRENMERSSAARKAAEAAQVEQEAAACRRSIECLMKKRGIEIVAACDIAIKHRARYEIKWDFVRPVDRYPARAWYKDSIMYLAGDALMLENRFGANERYSYECLVTPDGDVKDVILKPGRL